MGTPMGHEPTRLTGSPAGWYAPPGCRSRRPAAGHSAPVVGILLVRDHRRGAAGGRELVIAGIVRGGLTFAFWIGIAVFPLMIS
jgi:hypothetical protein